jgi:hypothetical protein
VSLKQWSENGWLKEHSPDPKEIAAILAGVTRDLADSQAKTISAEWRFNIAYNAILRAGAAALAAAGYRAARDLQHYRVLQSLKYTIRLDTATLDYLDVCRKKRHQGVYEDVGVVSDGELKAILALAQTLGQRVTEWIKKEHPTLLP